MMQTEPVLLRRIAVAAVALTDAAYGVAGGVLCVPPGSAQAEFTDAVAAYRLLHENAAPAAAP